MEYFFLLLNYFTCRRRHFWLRQIKVLLVVLTLAKTSYQQCQKTSSYSSYSSSCKNCGIENGKNIRRYVINGFPVSPPYRYPWMVAFTKHGQKNCGGAIISEYFIVTAAHCLVDKPYSMKVSFLTATRDVTPGYKIEKVYRHPKYNKGVHFNYDIGLVKLKKKITCDMYKTPICLPPENQILPPSTGLTLAGWGAAKGGPRPQYPNELLEGKLVISKCSKCTGMIKPDLSMCKKGFLYCMVGATNQASCFGDSGAPMFLKKNGRFYIHGVTSGGDSKCTLGKPFVFFSVSSVRSWIKKVAGV